MSGYAAMEKTRRKLPAEWAGQTAPEVSGLTSPAGVSNQAMISMLESQQERPAARPASGGTPLADAMRARFERQFGLPMDDVRVHRDSAEPAKFDAGAYTYGTDIFIGPGQEKLLSHEMAHVAQQKLGQVRPTGMEHGMAVNHSPALEHSADTGAVAQTMGTAAGPVVQYALKGRIRRNSLPPGRQDSFMKIALRKTLGMQRGNHVKDILDTKYKSRFATDILRNEIATNGLSGAFVFSGYFADSPQILALKSAVASETLGYGNCDDFSNIIAANLAENLSKSRKRNKELNNQTNKKDNTCRFVYICTIEEVDQETIPAAHVFVMASNNNYNIDDVITQQDKCDDDYALDGWYNHQLSTLGQYFNRNNPTRKVLKSIRIQNKFDTDNFEPLSDDVKNNIAKLTKALAINKGLNTDAFMGKKEFKENMENPSFRETGFLRRSAGVPPYPVTENGIWHFPLNDQYSINDLTADNKVKRRPNEI